ncbi:uncharacterized protein [Hetaerina americana]|uniref:uncharacterized protein n=1 Tax=Hetaerina americana TaxID=62018 RepID=UPI003A7F3A8B
MGNSAHSRGPKEGSLSDTSPKSLHRHKSVSSTGGERDGGAGSGGKDGFRENGRASEEAAGDGEAPAAVPSLPLTERQVALLEETWKELEENIARVGVIMYIGLFETHPDVQEVFMSFQGIELEELKHSKQLRSHALRVMGFVQKTVARLHEPEKLDVLLRELGKKHYGYSAKQEYIDLIGPQFIQAIKPSLEDKWSPELHDAWSQLFAYMSAVMKAEMDVEEKKAAAEEAAKAAKAPANATGAHRHHHKSGSASRRASSDAVGGGSGGGPLAAIRRGTMH